VRIGLVFLVGAAILTSCWQGTAPQELEQLRARTSILEAENAQLLGEASLMEAERDQLRQQVQTLTTEVARAQHGAPRPDDGITVAGEHLVIVPRAVYPGEWIAVYVRNYPLRLLPMAGVALRGEDQKNLAHVRQLAAANLFLLPIPQGVAPGTYQVVLGEAGALGPGAKIDDSVQVQVRGR
jgi:hypothetical protein